MRASLKEKVLYAFKVAVAVTPWLISMYVFYWLDSSGTWTSETPHRGKISVLILAAGMALSFVAWSVLARHEHK